MRHQEWHITVEGDPVRWHDFCLRQKMKPLYIELNDFRRQLLCAAQFNPMHNIIAACPHHFRIIRVKHEVSHLLPGDPSPLYYECHVKLDGEFNPELPMASRDLYRADRWYVTRRTQVPFLAQDFVAAVEDACDDAKVVGWEYEACLVDTNRALDAGWQ